PCSIADEQRSPAGEPRRRAAERQPVPAHVGDVRLVDAVLRAQPAQLFAKPRPLGFPAADADVDVVALREDPAVAARQDRELDHHSAAVPLARDDAVADVAFERDARDDVAAQPERAGGQAVRAVRADERLYFDRVAVDGKPGLGFDRRADAVPELGAGIAGAVDEELVEAASLRHQAEHAPALAVERAAVAEPA